MHNLKYTLRFLRGFFHNYIINEDFVCGYSDVNGQMIFSVHLYMLIDTVRRSYDHPVLMKYIMEILVQLLKDDYDLNLIKVAFYNHSFHNTPAILNLGAFANAKNE